MFSWNDIVVAARTLAARASAALAANAEAVDDSLPPEGCSVQ